MALVEVGFSYRNWPWLYDFVVSNVIMEMCQQKSKNRGTWVVQLVKGLTFGFGSGHDFMGHDLIGYDLMGGSWDLALHRSSAPSAPLPTHAQVHTLSPSL